MCPYVSIIWPLIDALLAFPGRELNNTYGYWFFKLKHGTCPHILCSSVNPTSPPNCQLQFNGRGRKVSGHFNYLDKQKKGLELGLRVYGSCHFIGRWQSVRSKLLNYIYHVGVSIFYSVYLPPQHMFCSKNDGWNSCSSFWSLSLRKLALSSTFLITW